MNDLTYLVITIIATVHPSTNRLGEQVVSNVTESYIYLTAIPEPTCSREGKKTANLIASSLMQRGWRVQIRSADCRNSREVEAYLDILNAELISVTDGVRVYLVH